MPKKEIFPYILTALLYALFVTFLSRNFYPAVSLFWLGVVAGAMVLFADPVASAYLTSPHLPFSQKVRQMIQEKRFKETLREVVLHHPIQEQPILHSGLFQAALAGMSLYLVSSSGSLFGAGLVLGMVLHLVRDDLRLWRDQERLNKMLFWNIHRSFSNKEQKVYLGVIFLLFGLETILLV